MTTLFDTVRISNYLYISSNEFVCDYKSGFMITIIVCINNNVVCTCSPVKSLITLHYY